MPISMTGRINIKMSILPTFLYLCQSIPLPLPASFFSTPHKNFTCFIWNNKHPYERGGLRLPNMKLYYRAAQLRAAMYYFLTPEVPAWIENNTLELPLHLYLYSAPTKILTKQAHNPFQSGTRPSIV